MERRRLADILHLGKPAMFYLINCWQRAVAAPYPFQAAFPVSKNPLPTPSPKGSLKTKIAKQTTP
ncbi:hypothetical protein [Kingella oralis]|uniref:hypothetical protein n=1 Tax=Kingella oralis TaxID=505 RepID=UPI0034E5D15C